MSVKGHSQMKTLVRCGMLIDGTGADPKRSVDILVEDGVIKWIQPRRRSIADADLTVDATELSVLPGFIDCHVHLDTNQGGLDEALHTPYSLSVAHMLANARTTLEAGVTAIRDAGGTTMGAKMAIERGLFPGPRLRISVNYLSQTGGHGDETLPSGIDTRVEAPDRPSGVADGIDGVRRATRIMLRAGADQIKVMASGGVLSPSDTPDSEGFSFEELQVIVSAAAAARKRVMAHAQGTAGIKNAVRAGAASIEHGMFLDEEAAVEMARRGTYFVPTLAAPISIIQRAQDDPPSVPSYALAKAREVADAHRESVAIALASGVRIAMGTDAGVSPHGSNLKELEYLVSAGLTPMQAIVAATRTAAECCEYRDGGTLEAGKRADFLGIAGDPLEDIRIVQDPIRMPLIHLGNVIVKSDLA
jgi:imidazolonepropionase-like amidohydrolase